MNYTRKVLALTLYFVPLVLTYVWLTLNRPPPLLDPSAQQKWNSHPWEQIGNSLTAIISISAAMLAFLLCALCLIEPLRRRSAFLTTAFAAIDRPEDRPFTVKWLVTSLIAMWFVIVAWLVLLPRTEHFLMVALFIAGVGDAVAEPVGIRFGRHKYAVRALGTDRLYTRSLEGSACVFVSSVVGIMLFLRPESSYYELVLSMAMIPVAATYAEARAPHTWDQPFILLACAVATYINFALQGFAYFVIGFFS